MSTLCSSPSCSFPALNGFLCRNCTDTLTRDLKAIPWLLEDLEITITRQDRLSDVSDRSSDEHPLPIRLDPMEVRRDLHSTLAAWAQHVAGKHQGLGPGVWTELALAQYLLAHIGDILTDPAAGECANEIGNARLRAQRTIDKPVERVFAGPCDDCDKDLYAHPSAAEVKCINPECGAVYPIEARRQWLLGKAEDQLLTATEMSRALPGLLGKPLTAAMLRGYAHRGRLTQHPPLPNRKDPLYKVGEVLDLLRDVAEGEPGRPRAIAS